MKGYLPEFSWVIEMMDDAVSPTKLAYEGSVSLRVDQTTLPGSEDSVEPSSGAVDVDLSVRFAEIDPMRSQDLPEGLDPELLADIMAEMAELRGMNDRIELIWTGPGEWTQTRELTFSDLMGITSDLPIDWIWWSDAPADWSRAFQQEMILRGAQESFDDDTVVLRRVIGGKPVDLRFKYIAPCMDWAILRGEAVGDSVLVRMRGLAAAEELPPIVGALAFSDLLARRP